MGCTHQDSRSRADQSSDDSDRSLYEEQKRVSAQQLLEFKQLYERWASLQTSLRNAQEELARRQKEREEVLRELQAEKQTRGKRPESKSEEGKPKSATALSKKEQTRQLKRLLHDLQELLNED
jgi:hypothetical protein